MNLHRKQCVFGVKQTTRAIRDGRAHTVYIAQDASRVIVEPVEQAALLGQLTIISVPSMRELGNMCGLNVDCSCAAEMK